MSTIEERVRIAFEQADRTGEPAEVLDDDGKRVMLIVKPSDRRPMPGELEERLAARDAELAQARATIEGLREALHEIGMLDGDMPATDAILIAQRALAAARGPEPAAQEERRKEKCSHCNTECDSLTEEEIRERYSPYEAGTKLRHTYTRCLEQQLATKNGGGPAIRDLPPCNSVCSECGVDATKLDDISRRRWWWSKGYGCSVCKPGDPPPLVAEPAAQVGRGRHARAEGWRVMGARCVHGVTLYAECALCGEANGSNDFAAGHAAAVKAIVAAGRHELLQHPGADGWFASWLDAIERGDCKKGGGS